MKIFIVSKAHLPRMHTFPLLVPQALKMKHEVSVVTHYKEQAADIRSVLMEHWSIPPALCRVYMTGSDYLVDSRNLIQNELTKPGQWYIGLDDNIQRFNMVEPELFASRERLQTDDGSNWRPRYRHKMSPVQIMSCFQMLMDRCEKTGTVFGGFASMENPFFRARKWSEVRFVKSKAYVMLNDGDLEWHGQRCGQDSHMSAAVVAKYGCVAVCNWIHPVHKMYEEGGIGSSEERRKNLDPMLDSIIEEFPGLVQRGRGKNTALRFNRTSKRAVLRWRCEQGMVEPVSFIPKGAR